MAKELFGGKISMHIPPSFEDVSDVRKVPDNQEAFADVNTDQSIIIEILEFVKQTTNDDAARYHFDSIATDNDAEDFSTIQQITQLTSQEVPNLPSDTLMYFCTGQQSVAKFNEKDPNARNLVNIYLALLRLPNYDTDIVITYNIPILIGAASSSRQTAQEGNIQVGFEEFKRMLATFKINNYDLFAA
ncbi:ran guanine nucleotide release factor [Rhizophagus clarus]|uniref:Ran guanine nucleotide release factor n=1 Tax=Rhizophagus clarus TaxID=94130 RepID=A0A8H3KT11_9GLOM|nr:ran guanine nucleotide release factor [Rhizophagus clarus]